jgi:hypothetical protein
MGPADASKITFFSDSTATETALGDHSPETRRVGSGTACFSIFNKLIELLTLILPPVAHLPHPSEEGARFATNAYLIVT